jgi:hypothetical protein
MAFGGITVGSTSGAQSVQLANTGNVAVSITSVSATGPYGVSTNCGSTLAAGASCQANVTFSPSAMGSQPGTLTFVTSAGNKAVALSGTGNKAVLGASPASLAFGSPVTGTTSSRAFTLSNTGNVAATSLGFSPSGGYGQSNNCGSSLAAGASCTVTVTFAPSSAGTFSGGLSVTSATGTLFVPLSGTGIAAAPSWRFSATSLNLQSSDGSPDISSVFITNSGNTNLTLSSITSGLSAASGDATFLELSGCSVGQVLTPGQACEMDIFMLQTSEPSDHYSGFINVTSQAGTVQIVLTGFSLD